MCQYEKCIIHDQGNCKCGSTLHTHAVYEEDFVAFKTVIPVSASVTEGEVVCAHSVQFGVISDEIIEDTQSFPVAMTTISPAGTLAVHNESLLTVNILDDDSEGTRLPIGASTSTA